MKNKKENTKKVAQSSAVNTAQSGECNDSRCPIHGELAIRGRHFSGKVTKVSSMNATIVLEKFVFVPKYERYSKTRTKLHAHIPRCMVDSIKVGDYIEIGECRPLSKTKHHVVVASKKVEKAEAAKT
ncbi:MAG: 30S ribosomal protein S17 [archaeon]